MHFSLLVGTILNVSEKNITQLLIVLKSFTAFWCMKCILISWWICAAFSKCALSCSPGPANIKRLKGDPKISSQLRNSNCFVI